MLDHELSRPGGAAEGDTVAVLLHGRGSHKGDLQGLRSRLPDDWTVVTPQAPHPGGPWGYGPGWAWYRYLEEDRVEASTLEAGLDALHGFLDDLPDLLGFLPGRLVLGGFSQGGTVSMVVRPGSGRGPDLDDPQLLRLPSRRPGPPGGRPVAGQSPPSSGATAAPTPPSPSPWPCGEGPAWRTRRTAPDLGPRHRPLDRWGGDDGHGGLGPPGHGYGSAGLKVQSDGAILSLLGTWRSPVAHLNGVQGVAGSNPAVPTWK